MCKNFFYTFLQFFDFKLKRQIRKYCNSTEFVAESYPYRILANLFLSKFSKLIEENKTKIRIG